MQHISDISLIHDPVHGYIPFIGAAGGNSNSDEFTERQLIDHPWLQRLRQIHQLQTAWWVFPSAEHTRFQHVIGVMHLASRAVDALYDSLQESCPEAPSRVYVHMITRLAGLLHDVGHGPFGHFFDSQYLSEYGATHETLGQLIIRQELGGHLRRMRRCPQGELSRNETIDPEQIAYLIARPRRDENDNSPRWLRFLRSLFCGIYTVDNMDFVLRDAYMTGYATKAFDLDRLLHYSYFSDRGLTIHRRGINALIRFMTIRGELFRNVYFHRTVRAIDLALKELFDSSKPYFGLGNPTENLDAYRNFTEWSLLVDVARWKDDNDSEKQRVGRQWQALLRRELPWLMVCQHTQVIGEGEAGGSSIFEKEKRFSEALRDELPENLKNLEFRVDLARHIYRPDTRGPAKNQNFLSDSATGHIRLLQDDEIFRYLPLCQRICRVYAHDAAHAVEISDAMDRLTGNSSQDDLTNM